MFWTKAEKIKLKKLLLKEMKKEQRDSKKTS